MRIKRIAAVAVLGLAAVAGMSACRAESGAALFVQDTRVDQNRVDDIVESAPANIASNGDLLGTGDLRQIVVGRLTIVELAKQVAAKTGQTLPGPDYAGAASRYQVNVDNPYARLTAEAFAYQPVLLAGATAVTPTDAETMELFTFLVQKTGDPAVAEQATQLAAGQLGTVLGERDQINKYMDEYNVVANPRYGDVPLPVDGVAFDQQLTYSVHVTVPTS